MLFFDSINRLARDTPWAHSLVLAYANYGVALFGALLLVGWWTSRRHSHSQSHSQSHGPGMTARALWAGAATVLALALNQPIVHAVAEARPYASHPEILVLAHRSTDGSFPSDHAVMAGAAAAGLWLVSRRLGAIAAVAALAMAFSRVYIAAHYPQDVVVGLLLGAAVSGLGWLLLGRPLTALVGWTSRTPLRPLVAAGRV